MPKVSDLSRLIILISLFGLPLSCGTYRTAGDYRGTGEYRSSSDYSGMGEEHEVNGDYRQKLNQNSQYRPVAAFKLYWPVSRIRVNRGFHPSSDPGHQGLDLGGPKGTPVMAAHEGVVIYAGHDFKGYGNMMIIEYSRDWATLYAHLDRFAIDANTIVSPGDVIGFMGRTGHATGVHLHFELMHQLQPVDPIPLLTRPHKVASLKDRFG